MQRTVYDANYVHNIRACYDDRVDDGMHDGGGMKHELQKRKEKKNQSESENIAKFSKVHNYLKE